MFFKDQGTSTHTVITDNDNIYIIGTDGQVLVFSMALHKYIKGVPNA